MVFHTCLYISRKNVIINITFQSLCLCLLSASDAFDEVCLKMLEEDDIIKVLEALGVCSEEERRKCTSAENMC